MNTFYALLAFISALQSANIQPTGFDKYGDTLTKNQGFTVYLSEDNAIGFETRGNVGIFLCSYETDDGCEKVNPKSVTLQKAAKVVGCEIKPTWDYICKPNKLADKIIKMFAK